MQPYRPSVNTDPAALPVAPAQPTPARRRVSRGQQRRADAMQEMREGLRLEANLARQQLGAPRDEQQRGLDRNELRHFIATLFTGGLWGPVWIWVLIRNGRRYGRTAQGRLTKRHVRSERARLRAEQKQRRRDNPGGFAEVPPRP